MEETLQAASAHVRDAPGKGRTRRVCVGQGRLSSEREREGGREGGRERERERERAVALQLRGFDIPSLVSRREVLSPGAATILLFG